MGKIIDYKTAKKRMKQKKRYKEKKKTFKHQPYYFYLGIIFVCCLLFVFLKAIIS